MILTALALTLSTYAAPAPASSLTDAQINTVLETINEGEINAAKIAMSHAHGKEAKNFAKMMHNEHAKNLQEAKNLAKKDKLAKDKSDLSESLKADAETSNDQIKKANKKSFDLAYLNEQVAMHQKALDTLKGTLIPAAQGEDLKKLLEDTSKHVESHLAMAKNAVSDVQNNTPTVK